MRRIGPPISRGRQISNEFFFQMQQFQHNFGFLFAIGPNSLFVGSESSDSHSEELRSKCLDLERLLSSQNNDGDSSQSSGNDIDGLALFDEIRVLCNVVSDSDSGRSPISILRYIYANHWNEDLSNLAIALRIVLTIFLSP